MFNFTVHINRWVYSRTLFWVAAWMNWIPSQVVCLLANWSTHSVWSQESVVFVYRNSQVAITICRRGPLQSLSRTFSTSSLSLNATSARNSAFRFSIVLPVLLSHDAGMVLRGGRGNCPLNIDLGPQMWHETLFDELKASSYRCKKERSVSFKICQNLFPTGDTHPTWPLDLVGTLPPNIFV